MGLFDFLKKKDTDKFLNLDETMKNLMEEDRQSLLRGEIPERRLIPHHAIKRDLIILAYEKDFQIAIASLSGMNWTEASKKSQVKEWEPDFNKKIYGIKRLAVEDLDKIIEVMKKTRTDFNELEKSIRDKRPIYNIVPPL